MVYRKKTSTLKKRYNSRSKVSVAQIAKIAKSVSLKTQETKHTTYNYGEFDLFDNVSRKVADNLLQVTRGVDDGSTASRIGDEVTLRGLKIYMNYHINTGFPVQTFKYWVLRHRSNSVPLFLPTKSISGILTLDPIDTEQCSVVTTGIIAPAKISGGISTSSKDFQVQLKKWIPLNNKVYKYQSGGTQGSFYNITMFVAAYNTGSVITQISKVAISTEFFFKDG